MKVPIMSHPYETDFFWLVRRLSPDFLGAT